MQGKHSVSAIVFAIQNVDTLNSIQVRTSKTAQKKGNTTLVLPFFKFCISSIEHVFYRYYKDTSAL